MTSLLSTLNSEISLLDRAGTCGLESLVGETNSVLLELRQLETELEYALLTEAEVDVDLLDSVSEKSGECTADYLASIENRTSVWYKNSIDSLKSYNGQISKFSRNVVNNSAFSFNLDDAYTYPLMVETHLGERTAGVVDDRVQAYRGSSSVQNSNGRSVEHRGLGQGRDQTIGPDDLVRKSENTHHLMRSIVLHFLKTGYGGIVEDLLSEFGVSGEIDPQTLQKFLTLGAIADDIRQKHDLTKALAWLHEQEVNGDTSHVLTSLKFHVLQFCLLLCRNIQENDRRLVGRDINSIRSNSLGSTGQNGSACGTEMADAHEAYTYAKKYLRPLLKTYEDDIKPFMNLLVFQTGADLTAYTEKVRFLLLNNQPQKMTKFFAEVLDHLGASGDIDHAFFESLATEFSHEFCKSMSLSTESSLFQAVLAGHVNLPSFDKYSQLQKKLGRGPVEVPVDLPFPLSARNQSFFKFHPIFVCPISKEQSMPLGSIKWVSDTEARDRKRKSIFVSPNMILDSPSNPVVVFEFCRHLALKDSVRNLVKTAGDTFKCHYCYKKHRLGNLSDAYFIDF